MTPLQPLLYLAEPTFALLIQGVKQVALGQQTYRYSAGQYLIYLVDLPLSSNVIEASEDEPLLGLGLTIKPERVAALLLESGFPPENMTNQGSIAVSELSDDLLDPLTRLLRLLDNPKDIPILAPSIEREILWRLINGEQGAMLQQLGISNGRMMQIFRAIRWIRNHYKENIRIDTLAQEASMSATSFHRHFLSVTSLSPIQFQKQVRLQMARTLIASSLKSVAEIGFEVGYDSPSQFSREYRRLFGRPPNEDGRFIRETSVANASLKQ
ncbi:AraC family transcriptional regulator N-terminal domain-containing protein [Rouxiella sp. Mn2063]|uniref:AraC family transcriptional regulator n=1 Tax=Rouxiella sp. Mn2063 TaxID=3395262 RepID=UPI003BBFE91E